MMERALQPWWMPCHPNLSGTKGEASRTMFYCHHAYTICICISTVLSLYGVRSSEKKNGVCGWQTCYLQVRIVRVRYGADTSLSLAPFLCGGGRAIRNGLTELHGISPNRRLAPESDFPISLFRQVTHSGCLIGHATAIGMLVDGSLARCSVYCSCSARFYRVPPTPPEIPQQ